jgi:release factor glutamine methyltransferase
MNYQLSADTVSELLTEVSKILSDNSIESHQTEAIQIITHFLKVERTQIFINPDLLISPIIRSQISEMLRGRCMGMPLQYLLGEVEFYNSIIHVTPDVLIPRPETELLVDTILQENPQTNLKVCDLCTGSGAIAISLKKARPQWQITATDISPAALKIAQKNAQENNCQIDFLLSDLFDDLDTKFDLIVCNPPYISEHDYENLKPELYYEPKLALTAPDNGLYFYKKIIQSAPACLNNAATLYLETGADQSQHLTQLANLSQVSSITLKKDYNSLDRFLIIKYL